MRLGLKCRNHGLESHCHLGMKTQPRRTPRGLSAPRGAVSKPWHVSNRTPSVRMGRRAVRGRRKCVHRLHGGRGVTQEVRRSPRPVGPSPRPVSVGFGFVVCPESIQLSPYGTGSVTNENCHDRGTGAGWGRGTRGVLHAGAGSMMLGPDWTKQTHSGARGGSHVSLHGPHGPLPARCPLPAWCPLPAAPVGWPLCASLHTWSPRCQLTPSRHMQVG